ncbi:MAG TPA: FMN-binding negative transcriptional regulator, partial [Bacteroidia bacterium]|nr:FMN-binding negative transcriptional regulator [Bacteroidia bacterium]
MYIPSKFSMRDHATTIAFMQQYSFATIVSSKEGLDANHLPFVVEETEGVLKLTSHFSRTNEQWKDIEKGEVMVIFSEPHAYISPKHYNAKLSVPTWDFIAVHAYGKVTIIDDEERSFKELEKMINNYDLEYRKQWDELPADYKNNMRKGIVMFEVEVTRLEAKNKQSQHKSADEKQRILNSLENSTIGSEREMGVWMR